MGAVDVGLGRMPVIQPRWQPRFDLHGSCVVISMYVVNVASQEHSSFLVRRLFARGKVQQEVML